MDEEIDEKSEKLENQFILRLPEEQAIKVHKILRTKPKKIKKHVYLSLDPETREGEVRIHKKTIPMKLVDLPTIIESYKTQDKKLLFKTADVCQMLVPNLPENDYLIKNKHDKEHMWPHGLAPPMKNVRKTRFRKVSRNKRGLDQPEIEKELRWLLKQDSEAIAVRWELIDDPTKNDKKSSDSDSYNTDVEKEVFGDIISESDDDLNM